MDLKNVYLTTLIPEFPRIYSYNNTSFKRYLDVIYNESQGVVVVPVNTTGRVKASIGEFVTTITDNLIVKKQWTNLYENTNTVDQDYYNTYIGGDVVTRGAVNDASVFENISYDYVDVLKTYYKIGNDVDYAFKCDQMGREIQILFDTSVSPTEAYIILLNPSTNGTTQSLMVSHDDVTKVWLKLIAVNYDASWGTTWAIKEFGGNITIY